MSVEKSDKWKYRLLLALAIVLIAVSVFAQQRVSQAINDNQTIGQIVECLRVKGIAYYCEDGYSVCAKQARLLGANNSLYRDCSKDSACPFLALEKYPTWAFKNGQRFVGVYRADVVGRRAGCV